MIDCLILGDSIAAGTQQYFPSCYTYAKVGINSQQFNKQYVDNRKTDFGAEVVIISLGSNDWNGIKTYNELYKLRERVKAQRVYWVSPNPKKFPKQSADIALISTSFGDTVLHTSQYQEDQIHPTPTGYKQIASEVK